MTVLNKFDFKTLIRLRPGGFKDNASLLSMALGGMAANPLIAGNIGGALSSGIGLAAAAAGATWAADRIYNELSPSVFDSELRINSDEPPSPDAWDSNPKWAGPGVSLGYCADSGRPLVVPWEKWMRHAFVIGQSGVGKTVMGEWIMKQQIDAGGGLLWIDGKLDTDNLTSLRNMCAWAGRESDLLVINPGNPAMSNSYSPILYGDADEVSSRVLSLMPSAQNNPGADYYRQSANQAVTTIIGAIQKTGRAYNFIDLTILLQNQRALAWLESLVPEASDERKQLSIFLEQFKTANKDGVVNIDMKKVKDIFGGVSGRLFQFGSGNFGKVTNTYTPEVNLFDAIRNNKIVYVMLPTMGKQEAASNFGKMVVGDFRTAISWTQALPKDQRPWPPFLAFFDEAGSYLTDAFSRMFEQSRSAHLVMLPAVQTMANLESISDELREMVIGNTWNKMFFKIGTGDTGEQVADLIGKEMQTAYSLSVSDGHGRQINPSGGNVTGASSSDSFGYSEREEEDYKVTPDNLRELGLGEAIITYGGDKVYHVKIPRVQFSKEFTKGLGPVKLNHARPRFVRGLDLFKDVDKWLSGGKSGE